MDERAMQSRTTLGSHSSQEPGKLTRKPYLREIASCWCGESLEASVLVEDTCEIIAADLRWQEEETNEDVAKNDTETEKEITYLM